MSLRFIYGRAGSGKTSKCLEEISSRIRHDANNPVIFLVPEQFTFQSERDLITALGTGGTLGTTVLSFRRLAYALFNDAGGITAPHLNSAGKCMIIFGILEKLKKELKIFSRSAERQGFVNNISDLLTEFKRYKITPDLLADTSLKMSEDEPLRLKLNELSLIYSEYEKVLEDRYRDSDDDLTLAALKLRESAIYNNAEIWIDGFSGFTPQEYDLIKVLMQKSAAMTVSLCTDVLADQESPFGTDVFDKVKSVYRRLSDMAEELGIEIALPLAMKKEPPYRFKDSPELAHLEKNLNSYPYKIYKDKTNDISLFSSLNIFSEIEECAGEIVRLVRDEGLRYRDIAVIAGSLKEYEKPIEVIFKDYEIPLFIDDKKDIVNHPLIRLILAMLEIFIENWSYEAVFRYLKTGFAGISPEQSDKLENYVLACGIRGSRWTSDKDWDMIPEFTSDERQKNKYSELLHEVNDIRRKVSAPLLGFRKRTQGRRTAKEICSALYDFLCEIGVPEELSKLIELLQERKNLSLADEYEQIWGIVIEVLDQVVEVTEGDSFSIERFTKLLKIGLSEYKTGLIPVSLDQVLVGSAERSKSHEIKALFILGVNDGVFPTFIDKEGILSDTDRNGLNSKGVELASDTRTKAFEEQFLVYKTLTGSGKYLRISWPIADKDGKSKRPSIIISRLRRIFPAVTEASNLIALKEGGNEDSEIQKITAKVPTFGHLVSALRKKADGVSILWKKVYAWYRNNPEWKQKCEILQQALRYGNSAEPISNESAAKLYGNPIYTSVSRLEKYNSCPFSFYIEYGLGAKERKVFSFSPVDVGSFMHEAVEIFSRQISELNIAWSDIDREWCDKKTQEITKEMLDNMKGSGFSGSKRYEVLARRLARVISRSLWLISEHIRHSSFMPVEYEVDFKEGGKYPPIEIQLDSGQKLLLRGRIDRVDEMTNEEGTYLRVIDYKSGSKSFKLSDAFYGLQIQLLTYLNALLEDGRDCIPGGVLYFRLDDPLIKGNPTMTEEEIESAIMKKLRMDGLILEDEKVIRAMDKEIDGASLIIPVRINKNNILSGSALATFDHLKLLRNRIRSLLKKAGEEIVRGNVAIRPYRKNNNEIPCTYCAYSAICQFDIKMSGNKYNDLDRIKDEEIWDKLK